MTAETIGVVFDCNVLLQALINDRGPAFACKRLVDDGRVTLFLSPDLMDEARDVLNRPKLRRKFSALTPERAEAFLQDLERRAVRIADVPEVFFYERDPKDEKYVNLAVAAGARYLVSRDNDLLDLMNETTPAGEAFRRRFPTLVILDPVALLRELPSPPAARVP